MLENLEHSNRSPRRSLWWLSLSLLSLSGPAVAGTPQADPALLVPSSKVTTVEPYEFRALTPAGTIVEIEQFADGSFDEATGDAVTTGDVFEPGGEMLSLADVVKKLTKPNFKVVGSWEFEHHIVQGWIYELNAVDAGVPVELHVDAKSGKILTREIDD